jgi:enoyl-CoA hydratase
MEVALSGERIPAAQLHRAGLINRLVPVGQALAVAIDLARRLSENAPLALAATKRVIVESADWPADQQFARQNEITAAVFGSADATEGAAAFAEKRPPVWRGQ